MQLPLKLDTLGKVCGTIVSCTNFPNIHRLNDKERQNIKNF